MKRILISVLTAYRHGRRWKNALAGVFAKQKLLCIISAWMLILCTCATTPKVPDELDMTLREVSDYLNESVPKGRKIAFVSVQSDSVALTEYVIDVLIANAVNDRNFSVVDRQQLDAARTELNFNWAGEVDDKSAQQVGKMLGAQTIITGRVSKVGDRYRLNIRALETETVQVQGSNNWNISAGKTITALLADKSGGRTSGGGSYGGTTTNGGTNNGDKSATGKKSGGKTATSTKAATPTYKIGDTGPAGGFIFYDKGNNRGGWQYLEAAPADTEREVFIPGYINPYSLGNKNLVGDGLENTRNMMAVIEKEGGGINSAPYYCTNLIVNDFNDWYLPSIDEITLMYSNLYLNNIGNFRGKEYWHSSIQGVVVGTYDFAKGTSGRHSYGGENDKRLVRACRRFLGKGENVRTSRNAYRYDEKKQYERQGQFRR
ncbi:CsgG/HfaB family protein [Treponema sp. R6D11]